MNHIRVCTRRQGNPDIVWCEWHVMKYECNGLAFQLIDDILDFTGTSTSLGKGSLSDIRHKEDGDRGYRKGGGGRMAATRHGAGGDDGGQWCSRGGDGIITAPILYAMEEFPQLRAVVDRGFRNPADVDLALDYLGKSRGIQRTRELAAKHATLASAAIDSLPESDDEDVRKSRRALVDLTHRVITRTK
ncbi:hypothetical protein RHMOL_Rhmol05G0266400 [Rhododendron molle]|uniref:Uncharacterized protein n=1 Tax=Rhododendron molle TaxID=49168 RepID=A0ACC0NVR6_RHOML|nr:hypothetical protein RHMOL_Rhmol05G0266400 [Rhododendron molle]